MKIAFLSANFPPEVKPVGTRTYRHAREWAKRGSVQVLTDVPHFPEGEVYEGYRNRYVREEVDGIDVHRIPMCIVPHRGIINRCLSYGSYMASVLWYGSRKVDPPDLVAASSPMLTTALAGYGLSRRFGVPFVLEIRDIWPESIIASDVMERNWFIRSLEGVEKFLYRVADHIVVVTDSFVETIAGKGVPRSKISVIKNGVDLEFYSPPPEEEIREVRQAFDLEDKFVVSYMGTIGSPHGVSVLLSAAERCDDDIVFMVVGTGEKRDELEELAARSSASNFRLVGKQPKSKMPAFLAASDASVVHLRDRELFKTVIPSKLFEAMAMGNPVIHGVLGESREIVERSGAGIPVTPESPDEMAEAARRLRDDPALYREMSERGRAYVEQHHDRRKLAEVYWGIFESVVGDELVVEA